jgi:hypothetical protein
VLDSAVCLINCMCRQSLERCMIKVKSAMFMWTKSIKFVSVALLIIKCTVSVTFRSGTEGDCCRIGKCDCMWGYVALLNWYSGMYLGFQIFIMAVFQMGFFSVSFLFLFHFPCFYTL